MPKTATPIELLGACSDLIGEIHDLARSGRKVRGSKQIIERVEALSPLLEDAVSLTKTPPFTSTTTATTSKQDTRPFSKQVGAAALAVHRALLATNLTFGKIQLTTWRRDTKFAGVVAALAADLQLGHTALSFALTQARMQHTQTELSQLNASLGQLNRSQSSLGQLNRSQTTMLSPNTSAMLEGQSMHAEAMSAIAEAGRGEGGVGGEKATYLSAMASYMGHGVPQNFVNAFELYQQAAAAGYPPAMNALAAMYRHGKGTPKDTGTAVQWYREAALRGDLDAVNNLAQMAEAGEGVEQNMELALSLYLQAANAGHLDAMTNLGFIYEHGYEEGQFGVPVDLQAATSWYRAAGEAGHARAQNSLGYLYCTGAATGTPDCDLALKWLKLAASQGHAGGQNNLGICYESGKGVDKDEDMALSYYTEAANQDHTAAQTSLGYLLLKRGQYRHAAELLRKASEKGSREACYHLGQIYHLGLGQPSDAAMAFSFYLAAGKLGHPWALLQAGHSYFGGRGTRKDLSQAFQCYKQSAEARVSEAENCLGIMLEEGLGCTQDLEQAMYYFQLAASQNSSHAHFNLGLLYEAGQADPDGLPDPKQAMSHFRLAADLGSVQASSRLAQHRLQSQDHLQGFF